MLCFRAGQRSYVARKERELGLDKICLQIYRTTFTKFSPHLAKSSNDLAISSAHLAKSSAHLAKPSDDFAKSLAHLAKSSDGLARS